MKVLVVGLVLAMGGAACSRSTLAPPTYRADFGRAPTEPVLEQAVASVLQRYGYFPRRHSQDQITAEWLIRPASSAEARLGVMRTRERPMITIRARGRDLFIAHLEVEYEAQYEGETWSEFALPDPLVDQYEQMERDIKRDLRRYMTQ